MVERIRTLDSRFAWAERRHPVVWGNRVFVSTTDENSKTLHAVCFDRATGKKLWANKVGDGIQRDEKSNFAAPSPVADADAYSFL
jgi:outer membrane protein assembly factor BamB